MFLVNISGVLLDEGALLNGAREFVEVLNAKKIPYVLMSQNAKKSSALCVSELRQKGLEVSEANFIDPLFVLQKLVTPQEVAIFGGSEFVESLEKLGFKQNLQTAKRVLVTNSDSFKFSEFSAILEIVLQNKAQIFAMQGSKTFEKNGRIYPGVSAICKMLEEATGEKAEVVGKPSKTFFYEAFKLLCEQNENAKIKDVCVISDSTADLVAANGIGFSSALILGEKANLANKKELGFEYEAFGEIADVMDKILQGD